MSNFQRTADWLATCGMTPGDAQQISTQIGCQIEEFCEWLRCLRVGNDGQAMLINRTATDLEWLAIKLKTGESLAHIPPHLRTDALDALCDIEVTGNGVAYMSGFDKQGADAAVLDSNDSKLEDGKAVLHPGGKIAKGKNYAAPELAKFAGIL